MPSSESGTYKIQIKGEKIQVRCEMSDNSTGWIVSLYLTNGFVLYLQTSVNFARLAFFMIFKYVKSLDQIIFLRFNAN